MSRISTPEEIKARIAARQAQEEKVAAERVANNGRTRVEIAADSRRAAVARSDEQMWTAVRGLINAMISMPVPAPTVEDQAAIARRAEARRLREMQAKAQRRFVEQFGRS